MKMRVAIVLGVVGCGFVSMPALAGSYTGSGYDSQNRAKACTSAKFVADREARRYGEVTELTPCDCDSAGGWTCNSTAYYSTPRPRTEARRSNPTYQPRPVPRYNVPARPLPPLNLPNTYRRGVN